MSTPFTRLGFERLEARENPAGNVFAAVLPDGMLAISGDSADNLISVQQNQFGDLYVFGRGGTTVNGQSAVYLGRGTPTNVYVTPGAGNDLIEMIGVRTTGWVSVVEESGPNNDGVALYGVIANGMTLQLRGGDDVVATDGVYLNTTATIDGGDGTDTIDYRRYGLHATGGIFLNSVERQVGPPNGSVYG